MAQTGKCTNVSCIDLPRKVKLSNNMLGVYWHKRQRELFEFPLSSVFFLESDITFINLLIDKEKVETVADFIFLGSKITAEGDCSH